MRLVLQSLHQLKECSGIVMNWRFIWERKVLLVTLLDIGDKSHQEVWGLNIGQDWAEQNISRSFFFLLIFVTLYLFHVYFLFIVMLDLIPFSYGFLHKFHYSTYCQIELAHNLIHPLILPSLPNTVAIIAYCVLIHGKIGLYLTCWVFHNQC